MATAGVRKTAIQNMVTRLQTITAGATYFRTMLAANVSTKVRNTEQYNEGKSWLWVRAGQETVEPHDISPADDYEATFEIVIDCIVKDQTGNTMVEELEDLLHDVSLCLGGDRRLNGAVRDSAITRIEPPIYGLEELYATTTVHVVCIYDYHYGVTI